MAFVLLAALIGAGNRVVNRGGGGVPTEVASDSFTYSNGSLAGETTWDASTGTWTIYSNQVYSGAAGANIVYSTATYSANQYSTATLASISGTTVGGVAVRCQSGSADAYVLWYNSGEGIELNRYNSGTRTVIQTSAGSRSSGVKLWLEVSGAGSATRLTAKEDTGGGWSVLWSSQDPGGTYIDGGKPGLGGAGDNGSPAVDDWSGGNL